MTKRILIIDDEENIRRLIRLALEAAGYEVGEASDGLRGLEAYKDGSNWDAILVDQKMPGMDGLETLRELRKHQPGAIIIMMTAYASIELAVDAMKLGATDFVRKPMTPEILRNAVAAALSVKRPVSKTYPPDPPQAAGKPIIKTITMNGFTVFDSEDPPKEADERCFTVKTPTGAEHQVLVKIDEEAVGYVERMTRRRLGPESSFWTSQAYRLLTDYLWTEGKVPPTRALTVKDVDQDELPIAERWSP